MARVTQAKMSMAKEKPFTFLYPRNPIDNDKKNRIRTGPKITVSPVKYKMEQTINNISENHKRYL